MLQTFRQHLNPQTNIKNNIKRNDSKNRKITGKNRICQFFTRQIKCYNTKLASLWKRDKIGKSYKFSTDLFLPTVYLTSSVIKYLNCKDNPIEGYLSGICDGDNFAPLKLRFNEANLCQEQNFQMKYYFQAYSENNTLKISSNQIVELCHSLKKRLSTISESDVNQKENYVINGQLKKKGINVFEFMSLLCLISSYENKLNFKLVGIFPVLNFYITQISSFKIVSNHICNSIMKSQDNEENMSLNSGYVTLNQEKRAVLMNHTELFQKQYPVVGIWISGLPEIENGRSIVKFVKHPYVFSTFVKFLFNEDIQLRVSPSEQLSTFLLIAFGQKNTKCFYEFRLINDNTSNTSNNSSNINKWVMIEIPTTLDLTSNNRSKDIKFKILVSNDEDCKIENCNTHSLNNILSELSSFDESHIHKSEQPAQKTKSFIRNKNGSEKIIRTRNQIVPNNSSKNSSKLFENNLNCITSKQKPKVDIETQTITFPPLIPPPSGQANDSNSLHYSNASNMRISYSSYSPSENLNSTCLHSLNKKIIVNKPIKENEKEKISASRNDSSKSDIDYGRFLSSNSPNLQHILIEQQKKINDLEKTVQELIKVINSQSSAPNISVNSSRRFSSFQLSCIKSIPKSSNPPSTIQGPLLSKCNELSSNELLREEKKISPNEMIIDSFSNLKQNDQIVSNESVNQSSNIMKIQLPLDSIQDLSNSKQKSSPKQNMFSGRLKNKKIESNNIIKTSEKKIKLLNCDLLKTQKYNGSIKKIAISSNSLQKKPVKNPNQAIKNNESSIEQNSLEQNQSINNTLSLNSIGNVKNMINEGESFSVENNFMKLKTANINLNGGLTTASNDWTMEIPKIVYREESEVSSEDINSHS